MEEVDSRLRLTIETVLEYIADHTYDLRVRLPFRVDEDESIRPDARQAKLLKYEI